MDVQLTLTDCYKAGDCILPSVLGPRDLVTKPDSMDETVLHNIRDKAQFAVTAVTSYQQKK